jgi:hypothetical protein
MCMYIFAHNICIGDLDCIYNGNERQQAQHTVRVYVCAENAVIKAQGALFVAPGECVYVCGAAWIIN